MPMTHLDTCKVGLYVTLPDVVTAMNVYCFTLFDLAGDNPTNAQVLTAIDSKLEQCYLDLQTYMKSGVEAGDFYADRVAWDGEKWETIENLGEGIVGVIGNSAADLAPHGVAPVVTFNTSRPQTRGRKFLPGIVETSFQGSTPTSAFLTALGDFALELLTPIAVVGTAYLASSVLGTSGGSAGIVYTLLEAVINDWVGYQRRRKPGVGM